MRTRSNNIKNKKSKINKKLSHKKSEKIKESIKKYNVDHNTTEINGNDVVLSSLYASMIQSFSKIAGTQSALNQLNLDDNYNEADDKDYNIKKPKRVVKKPDQIICPNKLCDHRKNIKFTPNPPKFAITLNYLIELGKMYHCKNFTEFNHMNLHDLHNIVPHMEELNGMIGMKKLKKTVTEQVFYFLKGNYKVSRVPHPPAGAGSLGPVGRGRAGSGQCACPCCRGAHTCAREGSGKTCGRRKGSPAGPGGAAHAV